MLKKNLPIVNEEQLILYPALAAAFGIKEALILEKLDSLLLTTSNSKDGHKWVKHSYDNWQTHIPFWSIKTIERTIRGLEKKGCIVSTITYNEFLTDKTKWYRIESEQLETLFFNER